MKTIFFRFVLSLHWTFVCVCFFLYQHQQQHWFPFYHLWWMDFHSWKHLQYTQVPQQLQFAHWMAVQTESKRPCEGAGKTNRHLRWMTYECNKLEIRKINHIPGKCVTVGIAILYAILILCMLVCRDRCRFSIPLNRLHIHLIVFSFVSDFSCSGRT